MAKQASKEDSDSRVYVHVFDSERSTHVTRVSTIHELGDTSVLGPEKPTTANSVQGSMNVVLFVVPLGFMLPCTLLLAFRT